MTFCDSLTGIEISFWTDGTGTDRWTDRRESRNSYLDDLPCKEIHFQIHQITEKRQIASMFLRLVDYFPA